MKNDQGTNYIEALRLESKFDDFEKKKHYTDQHLHQHQHQQSSKFT